MIGRRIRWSVQRRLSTLESVFSRRDVSRGSLSIFYPQEKEEKGNLSNKSIQMCNCHGLLIVRCVCRTVPAALPLYLTFPPSLVFMGNHNNNNCWSVLVRSTMTAACTTTEAKSPPLSMCGSTGDLVDWTSVSSGAEFVGAYYY